MAIWDEKEEVLVVTESSNSHKCASCGGGLRFHTVEGMLVCDSCGNRYYPESFEINELLSERRELDIDSDEAKKRAEEDEFKSERKMKHEIICNSCGATVVTDVNTVSTFCAFCGSTAIISDRLKKEFRPDYIIPFKLTKEEAMNKVKKWAKTRRFVPASFDTKSNYEKVTGIYVPFWLVDAECHMDIGGSGIKNEVGTDLYYTIRRRAKYKMKRVPFDGSKRINDRLMEAIEPYDYSEMVPFVDSYLNGMYAERYDLSPRDMAERICNRFRDYMYGLGSDMIRTSGYKSVQVDDDRSIPKNYKCDYALLPVWLLSFNYNDRIYRVAVNGQTGDIEGLVPESKFKRGLWKFGQYIKKGLVGALIITVLLSLIICALIVSWELPLNIIWGIPISFALAVLALVACVVIYKNGYMISDLAPIFEWIDEVEFEVSRLDSELNKPQEMPDVTEYLDLSEKVHVEKTDSISTGNVAMIAAESAVQAAEAEAWKGSVYRKRGLF